MEEFQSKELERLLMSVPAEAQERIVQGLIESAAGLRILSTERRPGSKEAGVRERIVLVRDAATGQEIEGYLYEVPPNVNAARILIEHGIGKPPVRERGTREVEIRLVHRVPNRKVDIEDEEEDLRDELEKRGIGMAPEEPPEPLDVIVEE